MAQTLPSTSTENMNLVDLAFKEYNELVEKNLKKERKRLLKSTFRSRQRDIDFNAYMPDQITAMSPLPTEAAASLLVDKYKTWPSASDNAAQRARFSSAVAATTSFAFFIGEVLSSPPKERTEEFSKLVKRIIDSATASGMPASLALKLSRRLRGNAESLLASFLTAKDEIIIGDTELQSNERPPSLDDCIIALGYLYLTLMTAPTSWLIVRVLDTGEVKWKRLKEQHTIGDACEDARTNLTKYLVDSSAKPNPIPTDCRVWVGETFFENEPFITSELRYSLTCEIVVDLVRSVYDGKLYERANIHSWLDEYGKYPETNEEVTRLDYISSRCAKTHAGNIARYLSAGTVAYY
ncbi:hypothetical protein G7Y89_g3775 [Cudoniella acicularis]|uniref:Uncharacterized protein n=1 Tax=Cudoniella acicularis TaxID=354080 RepID=A0A8H4RRJ1_9HELO|nr:hypothetical protein G7Y89_g3775 [Cudoniella acicularis]